MDSVRVQACQRGAAGLELRSGGDRTGKAEGPVLWHRVFPADGEPFRAGCTAPAPIIVRRCTWASAEPATAPYPRRRPARSGRNGSGKSTPWRSWYLAAVAPGARENPLTAERLARFGLPRWLFHGKHNSGGEEHRTAEGVEPTAPEGLALQQLQLAHLSLCLPAAPGCGERGLHRRAILLQVGGEGGDGSDTALQRIGESGLEARRRARAGHDPKSCCSGIIFRKSMSKSGERQRDGNDRRCRTAMDTLSLAQACLGCGLEHYEEAQ